MFDWVNPVSNFIMLIFTVVGAVSSLAWWLAVQFNKMRDYFSAQLRACKEEIINKLEYHERHDDTRFAAIRSDVMEIRLRNAAIDGEALAIRERTRRAARLRYLQHDNGSKKEEGMNNGS